jgi:tol-pal system protein YbgF
MMQTARTLRNRLVAAAALAAILGVMPVRAHAASKEIIQLQTQVQQLLDMVQRLQSTLDTRFAVLQNLAQQTSDQAVQMGATVNALQQKMNAENEALNGKLDTGSGQVQSLNDSVDELKTRIAKLEKSIQDMQSQLQNIQTPPAGGTASSAGATQAPDAGTAGPAGAPGMAAAPASQAPPLDQTFQSAMRDYNAAKYKLAAGEFQDVIHYYPLDNMAGTAQYYLGEIAYRQKNYDDAVKAYNAVLEGFSGNAKAPAAQLHKGFSLLQMDRREAGIQELRSLIRRYPQTPEAAQARTRLNGMGVHISPR